MPSKKNPLILIRGAGEMATGVAWTLHHAGFRVVMAEIAEPRAIRRAVAFSEAVYVGAHTVEGVTARCAGGITVVRRILTRGEIPVVVDPKADIRRVLKPHVVVDATLRKRGLDTRKADAPLVIGLGPGFRAGKNCHAAIETNRGHDLGRVLWKGAPEADTGTPAPVNGATNERVLRAPCGGKLEAFKKIGDRVKRGDAILRVEKREVKAQISGVVRGLLRGGVLVEKGEKVGDIDPRGDRRACFTLSDKARALGGAALLAMMERIKS